MPQVVVVPLDQSDVAERALPVAQTLASQLGARLHLVSVLEVAAGRGEAFYAQNEPWKTSYQEIETYLAEKASAIETVPVTTEILIALDPAYAIHSVLKTIDDPLLVLSTHGRSGFKRLVLGSTTTRIMQFANYPLVVVPARSEDFPTEISRILVALDGSTFAEHALQVALNLFKDSTPSICLIHVLSLHGSRAWQAFHDPTLSPLRDAAEGYLEGLASGLKGSDADIDWEVHRSADVAESLVERAARSGVDLIVMATHGRTGIVRAITGSVADGVLRGARKPILLIRPPDEVVAIAPESAGRSTDTN